MRRAALILSILLILVCTHGFALPPVFTVGAYGLASVFPSAGEATIVPGAMASARAGYRAILGSGYYATTGSASLRYYAGTVDDFTDSESLRAEIGLPIGPTLVATEIGLDATLHTTGNAGMELAPNWAVEAFLEEGAGPFTPKIRYSGLYSVDQTSAADVGSHTLSVGSEYRPGIRSKLDFETSGTLEVRPEQPVLDASGEATDQVRRDVVLEVYTLFERLIGFSTYWNVDVVGRLRDSTANRFVESLDTLEEDSRDTVGAELGTGITTSPKPEVSVGGSVYVAPTFYRSRRVIASDGTLGDKLLSTVDLGGSIQGDLTLNENLFLVGSVAGSRTFSPEDRLNTYWATMQLGLEYRF